MKAMKNVKKLLALLAVVLLALCAPAQAAGCPARAAECPPQTAGQAAKCPAGQTAGLYSFRAVPRGENVWKAWKICPRCQADSRPDQADASADWTHSNQPEANSSSQPDASANQMNSNADQTNANAADSSAAANINAYEAEVIRLVNEIRAENGLNALTTDAELCRGARAKSQDMAEQRYFDHNSPVYGTPFQMMKSFGITYRTAGENIAYGYAAPQTVMDGWMNSSGHRANILNASYTRIGVGYVANGNYWTQWFAG